MFSILDIILEITRKVYAQVPPKVELSITDYGENLQGILESMCKWGGKYATEHDIKF